MSLRNRTEFPNFSTRHVRVGVLAVLIIASAGGTLWIVENTPDTNIPVGISQTSGISMTPTYEPGGIAIYADVGGVQNGDVVVFHHDHPIEGTTYTMHRVVGENDRGLITRGDAISMTDQEMGRPYVTDKNRVGEVFVIVEWNGIHFPAF